MAKVQLVSPRNLVQPVTAVLQEAGVLHIESTPSEAMRLPLRRQVMDPPARQYQLELERLREQLRRLLLLLPETKAASPVLRSPFSAIGKRETDSGQPFTEDWRRVARVVHQVGSRVDFLTSRLKVCEDELALLSKYGKALETLAPFLRFIQESKELDHLGVTIEDPERSLPLLHEIIGRITENRYELFHARLDEQSLAVLLVFAKSYASRIRGLLWEEGISELKLPASVSDKPLRQALRIILKKKVDLPLRAKRYRDELGNLARTWRRDLAQYQEAIAERLEQMEATSFFYQTEMASFIYGWVPRRTVGALTARIAEEFGGKVVVEEHPIGRTEWVTVPVTLRNAGILKPFESLTRLIALPRYGSIDPTPYLAVFFTFFYGMILGDVGYGLVLLLSMAVVRWRFGHHPLVRDLSGVFLVASGAAILFGVLFGELFGGIGERVGLHPVFNRMEALLPFVYVSLAIGTLHISLGIVLGGVWAWRQGEWQETVAKLGGLLLVLGFGCMVAGLVGLVGREWVSRGLVGLFLSLPIIFGFGGARGAMELHNLVNVLSYLRLMGIGVASAAMAFAANKLGGLVGNLLLGIAIGGILHTINLAFGVLSPTVQALRLHYVEFFENFFAAGGIPYKPFKRGR